MMICTRCQKRMAVVFTTTTEGGEKHNEGLCLVCAKELGVSQVSEYIKQMGLSDEGFEEAYGVRALRLLGQILPTRDTMRKLRKLEETEAKTRKAETKKAQTTTFISYSRDDSEIVDKIEPLLKGHNIKTVRDVRDITYKQSIKAFMKRIRETDFAIIVISDSYLKSFNCMYEILEFIKDENYKERILPIVMKSADSIFRDDGKIEYIKFWERELKSRKKQLKNNNNFQNHSSLIKNTNKIEEVCRNIGEFLYIVTDMDGIVVDTNESYDKLSRAVDELVNYIRKPEKVFN